MDTPRLKKVVGFVIVVAIFIVLALSQIAATWSPCYVMSTDAGFNPVQYNLCIQNGRTAVNSMSSEFIKATGGTFTGTLRLNSGVINGPAAAVNSISGTSGCIDMLGTTADGGYWHICTGADYNLNFTENFTGAKGVVIQDSTDAGTANLYVNGRVYSKHSTRNSGLAGTYIPLDGDGGYSDAANFYAQSPYTCLVYHPDMVFYARTTDDGGVTVQVKSVTSDGQNETALVDLTSTSGSRLFTPQEWMSLSTYLNRFGTVQNCLAGVELRTTSIIGTVLDVQYIIVGEQE